MRLIFAALMTLALSLTAPPADAQDNAPASVITNQFDAFRTGDLDRAFSYASPMLQGYFRTPQNFGAMVRNGYSMVMDHDQTRMLDLRTENGMTIQRVEVIDRKGVVHLLDYHMVETEEGWKINGVEFVKAPPMAV